MTTPTISVVLPVHNGARYLRGCLDSVLAQTLTSFELIVADDASTDDSARILATVSDPRVVVTPAVPRRGLFATLNDLIGGARAPIVKILCQDDELAPTCLAETVAFFDAHPGISMLFHKCETIDESGHVRGQGAVDDLPETLSPFQALQHFLYHGCIPGNLSTVALRKSAFDLAGGFDTQFALSADFELWTRLCAAADMGVLQKRLLRLRVHDGQLSRAATSGLQFVRENRRIRRALLPRLPPDLQSRAKAFDARRLQVLDWHFAMRALIDRRPADFVAAVREMGAQDAFHGFSHWLLTLNNHVRRPLAPFVSDERAADGAPTADCSGAVPSSCHE